MKDETTFNNIAAVCHYMENSDNNKVLSWKATYHPPVKDQPEYWTLQYLSFTPWGMKNKWFSVTNP